MLTTLQTIIPANTPLILFDTNAGHPFMLSDLYFINTQGALEAMRNIMDAAELELAAAGSEGK